MKALALFALLLLCSPLLALVEWSSSSTSAITGRALVASGMAIFTSRDGRAYAIGADSGTVAWTYDAGGRTLFAAEQLDANTVAVVTDSGRLTYLGVLDGRSRGDFELKRAPLSFSAGGGKAFVGFNDSVAAMDANGRTAWSYSLASPPGPMRFSNGRLYFVSGERLYSLIAASGIAPWTAQVGGSFLSRPAEGGGIVYVGSTDGKLYAVEAGGGNLLWAFATGGWVMGSALADANGTYFGSNDGYFYSVDRYGHLRFRVPSPGGAWAAPEFHQGNVAGEVAFSTNEGKVYGVDASSGRQRWAFSTYGRPQDIAAWGGRTLIFGTDKGRMYSLSPSVMCSFDWPPPMWVAGAWPVDVEGRASAEAGVESVEVRANGGPWTAAAGKESWHATIDLADAAPGAINVECRVRDRNGRMDTQEFSYLLLVKSESAPLQRMYVEAPTSVGPSENFTVAAKDERGVDLKNVKITIGGVSQNGDSPFSVVLGKSGPAAISLDKPGFETGTVVVGGSGGTDWGVVLAGMALAGIGAYFLFGRKLLARKR